MKKFKGFTLIELIVVIAIIGVLCAILVPTMMGWVSRSRIKTNNANAKQVFTAAQEAVTNLDNQTGATAKTWSAGLVGTGVTDNKDLFDEIIKLESVAENSGAAWSVNLTKEGATKANYAENGRTYMGSYPTPIDEETPTDYVDASK